MKKKKLLTGKTFIIGTIVFILLAIFLFVLKINTQKDTFPGVGEYDEKVGEEEFGETKEKETYQYTLPNGEEVTIRIPKYVAPPSVEVVEELRKNQDK